MATEIRLEAMDKMLAELESREVVNPESVRVSKAISLYYPKLKALAQEKGYRTKDLHGLFCEMTGAKLTQSTFITYWQRAAREHKANALAGPETKEMRQDAESTKAEAVIHKDGDNQVRTEPAKPQAVRQETVKPAETAKSPQSQAEAKPEAKISAQQSEPVKQPIPVSKTHQATVKVEMSGKKPEPKQAEKSAPGFRTKEDIQAQGDELMRIYREKGIIR